MTPEDLGARLCRLIPGAQAEISFGAVTVDVPADGWVEALRMARDDDQVAARFFDFLAGVDDGEGGCHVVVHLYSPAHHHHLRLRAHAPAGRLSIASVTGLFAGASWHERETWEMFGVVFTGHPNLVSLLLPDGFEGHPLRKDFVLAARAAKAWPGAKEPGESSGDSDVERGPARRANVPPGLPPADSPWPRGIPVETKHPEGRR